MIRRQMHSEADMKAVGTMQMRANTHTQKAAGTQTQAANIARHTMR
jgi:hypothetical protein